MLMLLFECDQERKKPSYSWTSSPLLTFVSVSYWSCPPSVHWTTFPLHLSLSSHRTCPQFPVSPSTFLLPSKSPSSFPLSPSPSQVTPVRPLIRILSLGKCIVTSRWQLHVCVCVHVYASVWQFGQVVGGDEGSRLAFLTWQRAALTTDLTVS